MVTLVVSLGCAKSDWIQQTLVTVDVTGTWEGSRGRGGSAYSGGIVIFTLQQNGPKVTGQLRSPEGGSFPIEGTVNGDVFSFHSGPWKGELQVSGDEMRGSGTGTTGIFSYYLRRQP
jgi:hypothetical protein